MTDKILIDECLSAVLVAVAKSKGLDADYVSWIWMTGMQDWNIVPYALNNDLIFATNNRKDFLHEYAEQALHNGLIIVVPSVDRGLQAVLFEKALDVVIALADGVVNKIVEVLEDGSVHVREWTRDDHDPGHTTRPKWE